MKKISSRIPPKNEILKLFWVALTVTNFLSFLSFAFNFQAFTLKYTAIQILGILAYTLGYSLFEGLFVVVLFLLMAFVLPKEWLRDQFSFSGSILYIFGTIFLFPWIGFTSRHGRNDFYIFVNAIPPREIFITLWVIVFTVVIYLLVRIYKQSENRTRFKNFLERLSILAQLYFFLDVISLCFVLIRILQ